MAPTTHLPDPSAQPELPLTSSNVQPAFDSKTTTVVFILGGPGSGKGTQSENLKKEYGFHHFSAGDLLREEQDREGSQFGQLIKDYIKEGTIVPMEVTVKLLENAMRRQTESSDNTSAADGTTRFLIDGFPRKLDQAVFFEETVCPSKFTLFLDCPEDVMEKRLMKRGLTSGRADDNAESIKKRFRVFVETSMPVVDMFESQDRVVKVDATGSLEEVWERVKAALQTRGVTNE